MTAVDTRAPETAPEPTPPVQVVDGPRQTSSRTVDDWLCLFGSAAASLCLVWLLYLQVLPTQGLVGFVVCWYVAFVGLYAGLTLMSQPRPVAIDRVMSAVVQGAAGLVGFALVVTVGYVFVKGWPAIRHLNFFTHSMAGVRPTAALSHGGISHAIVGSGIELTVALIAAVPLGIATAVYLSEVGGGFARIVRTVVEAMTALPDLIAGLFVYTVLIIGLGYGRTGLAAGLALAITMMPIIARSAEVALRLVPSGLREASLALGSSQLRMIWTVVLPTARAGLTTSLILSIARGIGETAPVLITSGASSYFNTNAFQNPMNSLPLFIYSGVRSGQPVFIQRAFGAAAVLLIIIIVLFAIFRVLTRSRASR